MPPLYSNENLPLPVVERLRQLGHNVLTIQETGRAGEGVQDSVVLAFAVREKRAVLTLNRSDFMRLHRADPKHYGIVVCTVDEDFGRQAMRIDEAIKNQQSLEGQLIRVNRPAK